jgi:hypothetical protein
LINVNIKRWFIALRLYHQIQSSFGSRLIIWVGLVLTISISGWAYFDIAYRKEHSNGPIVKQVSRQENTIKAESAGVEITLEQSGKRISSR